MYRSRDRLPADGRDDELGDLFAQARSDNQRRTITGALLLSGRRFVQVLEGDQVAVRSLFSRIQADPRHDEVELLFAEPADYRTFAHWSMARVSLPDSDIPLIALLSEISPVGTQTMTPAKTRLLARDAAGDRRAAVDLTSRPGFRSQRHGSNGRGGAAGPRRDRAAPHRRPSSLRLRLARPCDAPPI